MKTKHTLILFILIGAATSAMAQARAFHKGALLVSISEGSTTANYSTSLPGFNPSIKCLSRMDGIRDPLFIEYGLSKHWGIGLSTGNDIFSVNSRDYYGFNTNDGKPLEVKTSEFTFDLNYHLYAGRRTDWSVYGSVGSFGVNFKSRYGENNIDYSAKGGIVRMGTRFRYYFWKRLGALVMVSAYAGEAAPREGTRFVEGQNYSTRIAGTATEFGLCFRFF